MNYQVILKNKKKLGNYDVKPRNEEVRFEDKKTNSSVRTSRNNMYYLYVGQESELCTEETMVESSPSLRNLESIARDMGGIDWWIIKTENGDIVREECPEESFEYDPFV
jgi:hypothetical protein